MSISRRALLRTSALLVLLVVLLGAAADAGAATRTWVSGVGDDANPCSRTAPCKTFAGAISKTDAGGIINVLDPGAYGAVTITKAITIDATDFRGHVLHSATNGIVINAAATDDVVLRGLEISGASAGVTACPFSGLSGVRVLSAKTLRIEDTTFSHDSVSGIEVVPTTNPLKLFVNRVDVTHGCTNGINIAPAASQVVDAIIRDTTISTSGNGLRVASGGNATVIDSTISQNTTGLVVEGSGKIALSTLSQVIGNTTDGTPTSVFGPVGPQGAAGPQGPAAFKLLLALPVAKLNVLSGRVVSLKYVATTKAKTVLTVRRGKTVVATLTSYAKVGTNAAVWSGRIGGKAAPAATYTLQLRSTSSDDQVAVANASVRILAPRR